MVIFFGWGLRESLGRFLLMFTIMLYFLYQEKLYLAKLSDTHENQLRRLSDSHREKIALLDRQFLQQKQQLMRQREAAIWEMEERQLHESHQLAKRQLKDMFFLQRHQMLVRQRIIIANIHLINPKV